MIDYLKYCESQPDRVGAMAIAAAINIIADNPSVTVPLAIANWRRDNLRIFSWIVIGWNFNKTAIIMLQQAGANYPTVNSLKTAEARTDFKRLISLSERFSSKDRELYAFDLLIAAAELSGRLTEELDRRLMRRQGLPIIMPEIFRLEWPEIHPKNG